MLTKGVHVKDPELRMLVARVRNTAVLPNWWSVMLSRRELETDDVQVIEVGEPVEMDDELSGCVTENVRPESNERIWRTRLRTGKARTRAIKGAGNRNARRAGEAVNCKFEPQQSRATHTSSGTEFSARA